MQRALEILIHGVRFCIHKFFFPYHYFGSHIAIDERVKIYNPRAISIADYVRLQDHVWLNVVEPTTDEVLKIGHHCDIGRNSFLTAKKSIVLEEYVLLAPNVFISDHSHRYDDPHLPILLHTNTEPKPVRIKWGTWIGTNSVILPGVTIGAHCVIGANSVVNRSMPDYSVAVGSPAKVVKKIPKF